MLTITTLLALLTISAPAAQDCPETPSDVSAILHGSRWEIAWDTPACPVDHYDVQIMRTAADSCGELFVVEAGARVVAPRPRAHMSLFFETAYGAGAWCVRLVAVSELATSPPSAAAFIRFPAQPPPPPMPSPPSCPLSTPTDLSATVGSYIPGSGTPVTFVWSAGGTPIGCPVPGYLLVVGLAADRVDAVLDLGAAQRPLTVMAPRGRYYVRLVAYVVGVGQSAPSAVIRVDVP